MLDLLLAVTRKFRFDDRWQVRMASEKQYSFFKSLYDEESERTKILAEHSKNNLGLATLYSAFILFVFDKHSDGLTTVHKGLFIAAVVSMLIAFSLSLWATQISNFAAVTDPEEIFATFKESPPSDEDFFDDRIVDYSAAYDRNSLVNDRKAVQLLVPRYFLLFGITLHAAYFIFQLI